ncbi:unnamed protein product, partial [Prorocentrum cordatum]
AQKHVLDDINKVPNLRDLLSRDMAEVRKALDEDATKAVLIGSVNLAKPLEKLRRQNKTLLGDRDTRANLDGSD